MFGFLIKKSFFDLWDHFLPALIANLGFIFVLSIPVFLPQYAAEFGTAASLTVLGLGVLLVFVYLGGISGVAATIADYGSVSWHVFFTALRANTPTALLFGTVFLAHIVLLAVGLPVYGSFDNFFGLFAIAVLFWMSAIWWLAAQFILPVRSRLATSFPQVIKKSFLLTFDNLGFSIGLAIGSIVVFAVSIATAFLVPGVTGLLIWYQSALRLRIYKYDYLENNPDAEKADIPWDALLYEDRERVGKRTLRGMIFPWKE